MTTTTQLRDGSLVDDPRLDRLIEFDEQSRSYQIRDTLHSATLARRRYVRIGPTLDQGPDGACVGFSATHAVSSAPHGNAVRGMTLDARFAKEEVYWPAQRIDPWAGGSYPGASPQYEGTSVLAGMKALVATGAIDEYRWIGAGSGRVMDDLIDTVRSFGPVVLGTWWHHSMFATRPSGRLAIDRSSAKAGGHAWTVHDAVTLRVPGEGSSRLWLVCQNSWGPWGTTFRPGKGGQRGFMYVDPEELEPLLEDQGEGAVPIQR